jgi:gamma-glutamylcyclotransferase (GGCT)/AIG2-like uncharacterized protein YtfP
MKEGVAKMVKVFVYGTLRKGQINDHYLQKTTCISDHCWTLGEMYDTYLGYPAVKHDDSNRIYREMYIVTEGELALLDELEDYQVCREDNLYDRILQTVYTDKSEVVAYIYIANKENLLRKRIVGGDWKKYKNTLA